MNNTRLVFLALAALVLGTFTAHAQQTASITISRTGGTASSGAAKVVMYYSETQPTVDAQGRVTAMPGRVVAATFTGNNPASITASAVPIGKRLWFTWQAVSASGIEGNYLNAVAVDLAVPVLDGTLSQGNVTVTVVLNKGATLNLAAEAATVAAPELASLQVKLAQAK